MLRIKELRKMKKISGPVLAEKLHITPTHLYDIENGKKRIHAELLSQIADILGTSTDYLLGRSDTQNEDAKQQDEPTVAAYGRHEDINGKVLEQYIKRWVNEIIDERLKNGGTTKNS